MCRRMKLRVLVALLEMVLIWWCYLGGQSMYQVWTELDTCPEMSPVAPVKKQTKNKLSCVKLAICPEHQRRRSPPEILHAGSCPGSSYQISWKSVEESRSCGWSKMGLSHWQAPWLIQQLVLPYKPWSHTRTVYASVLKATKQVNGKGQNSTPRHTKTP